MQSMNEKYKKVHIPAGTLFFRRAPNSEIHPSMFFSFSSYGSYSCIIEGSFLQFWETKTAIISHLTVKEKLNETDIEWLYNQYCGDDEYYLNIKNIENPKRQGFLDFLKQNDFDSWVDSVENGTEMEFHLFSDNNSELVRYIGRIEETREGLFLERDSFCEITIVT